MTLLLMAHVVVVVLQILALAETDKKGRFGGLCDMSRSLPD